MEKKNGGTFTSDLNDYHFNEMKKINCEKIFLKKDVVKDKEDSKDH